MPIKHTTYWESNSKEEIYKNLENEVKTILNTDEQLIGLDKIGTAIIEYDELCVWYTNSYKDFGSFEKLEYWNNFNQNQKMISTDEFYKMIKRSFIDQRELEQKLSFYGNNNSLDDVVVALGCRYLEKMKIVCDYNKTYESAFDLHFCNDDFAIISYGAKEPIIVPVILLSKISYFKDLMNLPSDELIQLHNYGLAKNSNHPDAQLTMFNSIDEYERITTLLSEVDNCEEAELKALKYEYDKQLAELEMFKNEIYKIQMDKERELVKKLKEMKTQIFMLDTQIYSIRCYLGEAVRMHQVKTGKQCDISEPIVLNQKLRYLDEELTRLNAITPDQSEHTIFEEYISMNEKALDLFCPSKKSISMIRISKSGKKTFTSDNGLLNNYDLLHGSQLGILVRNGDCVWLGWCDEKRIFINDDVFVSNNTKEQSTKEIVASRVFIFSVLEGLQEFHNIINLPEKVIFSHESKYLKFSSADTFLEDTTYIEFASLIKKLNRSTREGDNVLVLRQVSDGYYSSWDRRYLYERGTGNTRRTEDASVCNGIHKITFVQHSLRSIKTYVSASKSYSNAGATARLQLYANEYLNLNWLNSKLIAYYIDTKRVGLHHIDNANLDYAEIVKYLLLAKEYCIEREESELSKISKYMDLNCVENWQNFVSSWKLIFQVREINDFQARRFIKWFKNIDMNDMNTYKDYLVLNEIEKYVKPPVYYAIEAIYSDEGNNKEDRFNKYKVVL